MTCLSTLRRLALIPAATLVLLAALPAQAAEPSPAKKELIAKIISLQQGGIDGIARSLVEQPAMALMQQAGMILQTRVAPEKREALAKEIQADVRKYVEEATPIVRERAQKAAPGVMGALLDERFTEDELKQLVAWLESPVVRRYQQMTPDIQKGMSEKLVADTRAAVEPKLQALDRNISTRLGVQPPASAPAKK